MDKDSLVSQGTFIEFSWHSYETDGLLADMSDIEDEPELGWLLNPTLPDPTNNGLPVRLGAADPDNRGRGWV
jgi:hypothetical protein